MPAMPDFGAMMWVTVIGSLFVPLIIAGVVLYIFMRSRGRQTRLRSGGVVARATVTAVGDTGVTINGNPRARFELLIEPSSGPAFNGSATQVVSRLAIPRVGDVVAARYAPGDTGDVMIAFDVAPPAGR